MHCILSSMKKNIENMSFVLVVEIAFIMLFIFSLFSLEQKTATIPRGVERRRPCPAVESGAQNPTKAPETFQSRSFIRERRLCACSFSLERNFLRTFTLERFFFRGTNYRQPFFPWNELPVAFSSVERNTVSLFIRGTNSFQPFQTKNEYNIRSRMGDLIISRRFARYPILSSKNILIVILLILRLLF